jgi:CBS domain-containing protein
MQTHFDDELDGYSEFEEKEAAITHGLMTAPIRALDPRAPVCVAPDATLAQAVARMNEEKIGALLVEDQGKLVGIFTERDVLTRVAGRGLDFTRFQVREFMTADPEALSLDHKLAYALNKMVIGGYRHVPLVEADGRPVGMISVRDVVEFIVERFPDDVLNLPPDPAHEMRRPFGG